MDCLLSLAPFHRPAWWIWGLNEFVIEQEHKNLIKRTILGRVMIPYTTLSSSQISRRKVQGGDDRVAPSARGTESYSTHWYRPPWSVASSKLSIIAFKVPNARAAVRRKRAGPLLLLDCNAAWGAAIPDTLAFNPPRFV